MATKAGADPVTKATAMDPVPKAAATKAGARNKETGGVAMVVLEATTVDQATTAAMVCDLPSIPLLLGRNVYLI